MALDDLVSVSITLESASVDRASFGIPLIAAYHVATTNRVDTYEAATALADMVSDGHAVTSRAYLKAQAILSANPRVSQIKIGRRDGAWVQLTKITPVVANTTVYSHVVNGTTVTFTSDGSALLAEVCTGLAAAIDALPLVTADGSSGTHIIVTTTAAGTIAEFGAFSPSNTKIEDTTVAASVAADLAAIRAADDVWYAFELDSDADAEILLAAAFAEANKVIYGFTVRGTRAMDAADTTDTATTLKTAAYTRSFGQARKWDAAPIISRWIGEMLPSDPSFGESWCFSELSGITVEALSSTELAALRGKNLNTYVSKGGKNITLSGYVVKSKTLFIDQITLIDELTARIQERVFALLVQGLPYSNESADRVCGEILAELNTHIERGSLLATPKPFATHPDALLVSPVDRAARTFPDIHFGAQGAGRLHGVTIAGKVSV